MFYAHDSLRTTAPDHTGGQELWRTESSWGFRSFRTTQKLKPVEEQPETEETRRGCWSGMKEQMESEAMDFTSELAGPSP